MVNISRDSVKTLFKLICIVVFVKAELVNVVRVKRIVGGKAAAKPPADDPVVFTRVYNRAARVEGFRNKQTGIYSFLGLRYADPPIGSSRFSRPRYRWLQGDINATLHGPPCPQPDPKNPHYVIGNEDCLLLNVYTPRMPDESTGLPVYLWIHPGGFRYGSAAQYDAEPIAQAGIIFVPIQYRLGTLGIIGDGTKEFNGNLAMFDMSAALRWVTEYISFFGGDPKQIKIMGHGSGAASAMYMSMSKLPRSGSITGVVAMSGSALSQYANDDNPVQSVEEIAEINECPTSNEISIVKCLRAKRAEDIVLKDSEVQTERLHGRAMVESLSGGAGFNPHVEQTDDERALPGLITDRPEESIATRNLSGIPLLIGCVKQETGNALNLDIVESIWGTASNLLNSLQDTLGGLKSLLNIDELTGAIKKPALPGVSGLNIELNNLLDIPQSLNPLEIIEKVTEVTTDALFNLPAMLSVQTWAKTSSAYLYNFEYKGSKSKGINFLRGLPIVSSSSDQNNNAVVAHGDELGYLFNANDIEGRPLLETRLTNKEDLKVRQNLISLLLDFTKSNRGDDSKSLFNRLMISGDGTPFIKIGSNLEVGSDFRVCELMLWGAKLNPGKTANCQGLVNQLGSLTGALNNITTGLTDVLNLNGNRKPSNGLFPGGGILG